MGEYVEIPRAICGMRIRQAGDGSVFISRNHKEAEEYLDKHLVRMPNQLRWWTDRSNEWPSTSPLKDILGGQEVYMVGKGPSLDDLTAADFPNQAAPVLCMNQSIHKIKEIGLPNLLIGVQYDGNLGERCYAETPMIVTNRSYGMLAGKADIFPFREKQYGNLSVTLAINVCREMGAKSFVLLAFDASMGGRLEYADCIGESAGQAGSVERFKGHKDKILEAAGDTPLEFRWPKTDASPNALKESCKPDEVDNVDTSELAESCLEESTKSVPQDSKESEEETSE